MPGRDAQWIVGAIAAAIIAIISSSWSTNARIDNLQADIREMRATMERFDSRLDAVDVALAKVEQRLETLERAVIPPAAPAAGAPHRDLSSLTRL